MSERPIDEIKAAHEFVATIPPDGHDGPCPWWHGHAIHEAYWAGLDAKADLVPDLLTACEVARARLVELTRAYKETQGEAWTQDFDYAIQACEAAIAKAKQPPG